MQLEPGMQVTPNVRLVRPLGEGGMGCVWVGEHLTLKTEVAVKFISSEAANSPEAHARFAREASAAAQIRSPHVVQTFDHGLTPDDVPYIVMELLEGEDLAEHIFRVGTLDLQKTAQIVEHVAKALAGAHKLGIVHRDIKPDNIYLTEVDGDLFCKVLDFGVAKWTSSLGTSLVTSVGAMVGTPAYMSPEQILSDKPVDFRSDLWSVGVCAYHALTGDTPFNGETLGAICVAIADGKFTPPSKVRPELPAAVDAWMARALAVDPAARFSSAKEMATTLAAIARGEGFDAAVASEDDDADGAKKGLASLPPGGGQRRETAQAHTIVLGPSDGDRRDGKRSSAAMWLAVGGLALAAGAAAVFFATRGEGSGSEPAPSVEPRTTPSSAAGSRTASATTAGEATTSTAPPASSSASPPASSSAAEASATTSASTAAPTTSSWQPAPSYTPTAPTYTAPKTSTTTTATKSAATATTSAPATTTTTKDHGF